MQTKKLYGKGAHIHKKIRLASDSATVKQCEENRTKFTELLGK